MAARRRERWYSIEGQRRVHRSAMESSKGPRQLISLVALLVLTLIAIQQVSDPKRVGRVAGAIGLLPAPSSGQPSSGQTLRTAGSSESSFSQGKDGEGATAAERANTVPTSQELGSQQNGEAPWVMATLQSSDPSTELQSEILAHLMTNANSRVVDSLAGQLFASIPASLPTSPTKESDPAAASQPFSSDTHAWIRDARVRLQRWIELSDSTSSEHTALMDVDAVLQSLETSPRPTENVPTSLKLALDRTLIDRFSDNTPWRSTDRWPLVRTLQRAVALHAAMRAGAVLLSDIPRVAVPQLMSDTAVLRGTPVRIEGTIAKLDSASTLELGAESALRYQVIWIKPTDGSNQPVLIYVPEELGVRSEDLAQDRAISIAAMVAKKRAYAAQRGGEVAPVLVACSVAPAIIDNTADPLGTSSHPGRQSHAGVPKTRPMPWTPPVDSQGALNRVLQRMGTRMETLASEPPTTREAWCRDENALAILLGFKASAEEIAWIWNAGDAIPVRNTDARLVRFAGSIERVERVPIPKPPFPSFEWKEIFACTVRKEGADPSPILVLLTSVPSFWLQAEPLQQPVVVTGLEIPNPTQDWDRVVLGAEIQWRYSLKSPAGAFTADFDPTHLAPILPTAWQSLLRFGWDLRWIDVLESMQGQPMSARESEAFYTLLRASRSQHIERSEAAREAGQRTPDQPLSVLEAIGRAEKRKKNKKDPSMDVYSTGFRIEGDVQIRRVQRIDVVEPTQRGWLEAPYYYQLDGFADIGNTRISIQYDEADQPIIFEKEFPITLVAAEVPDELLTDSGDATPGESQAWYPRARMHIDGWFYRMWRFKTTQVSQATDGKQSQQGPIVVVHDWREAAPVTTKSASQASPWWITMVSSLIGIVGAYWILRQVRQGLRSRRPA